MSGHVRQLPAYFMAAGVPNVSSSAGDPTGVLLGSIAGSPDVMVYDLWGGAARDKSNVTVFGAEPGHGKSSLIGMLADHSASCGVQTSILDPSGPLARLCTLPHMRGNARHLDVTSAAPGTLCPSLMVVDPRRGDYETENEFNVAVASARMERVTLMSDTLRDALPYLMVARDQTGNVQASLDEACIDVGGDYGADPWEVVDRLSHMGELGQRLANRLRTASELPSGVLIFPAKDVDDRATNQLMNQAVLTVLTMEGLVLPPDDNSDRSTWSSEAQASVPILNLAARLVTRSIYSDFTSRKSVFLDELGLSLSTSSAFASTMQRLAADSRKRRAFVGLVFQNPEMLSRLGDQISNLIGSAFIGRLEDEDTAKAALKLLRLKEDSGYHHMLQGLEQGEFAVRDWGRKVRTEDGSMRHMPGRVRKVLIDRDWWDPSLLTALDTNPGGEGTYDETEGDIFTAVGAS